MTNKNPKRKGSQFERDIARELSWWWDKKSQKNGHLIFWRTAASGAASHISQNQYGDITYIDPSGKPLIDLFVIECKRTRRFNLFGIVAGDNSLPIIEWLSKLKTEAVSAGKYGMLIFKLDRYPIMMAIETCISKKLSYYSSKFNSKKVLRLYKPYPFDFYKFDDFRKFIDRETIIKIWNDEKKV